MSGLLLLSLGGSIVFSQEVVYAEPPACYVESPQGEVTIFPVCDYEALGPSGFVMGSLPNPLSDDHCYFWGPNADDVGVDVTEVCDQPPFSAAANFGSNPPPPVSLPDTPDDTSGADPQISVNQDREALSSCGVSVDDYNRMTADERAEVAQGCLEINPIVIMTKFAINIMSALAGVVIVAVIAAGGIQYSTAGANPQAVGAAKGKIINALIALLCLIFLFSFLQWLIPGGIF